MISDIIREVLDQSLEMVEKPFTIQSILRMKAEVTSVHRNWILTEAPKFYVQLAGATKILYPGGNLKLPVGQVLLMAPHIPHFETRIPGSRGFTSLVVNFRNGRMQLIVPERKKQSARRGMADRDYVDNAVREACLRLVSTLLQEEGMLDQQAQMQAVRAFLELARCGYRVEKSEVATYPAIVEDTLQQIHEKISDASLNVQYLARRAGCSPEHLSRLFSKNIGTSLKDYLSQERMRLAESILLSRRDETVASVAYMAGFSSSGYFCTCFKKSYGQTPENYRQSQRN